jgi:hypothetical protein
VVVLVAATAATFSFDLEAFLCAQEGQHGSDEEEGKVDGGGGGDSTRGPNNNNNNRGEAGLELGTPSQA